MNLQSLVEYIARALVENKDAVAANVKEDSAGYLVELHVAQADMGRVIGKGGRIANAIRTLVRIAAMREGKRATLDIV
jgi:predicted RNA-binding protein YlqC (UPF0109 family)